MNALKRRRVSNHSYDGLPELIVLLSRKIHEEVARGVLRDLLIRVSERVCEIERVLSSFVMLSHLEELEGDC